ncbi:hypothetical protein Tco_0080023 [Tanacetum coccineum]
MDSTSYELDVYEADVHQYSRGFFELGESSFKEAELTQKRQIRVFLLFADSSAGLIQLFLILDGPGPAAPEYLFQQPYNLGFDEAKTSQSDQSSDFRHLLLQSLPLKLKRDEMETITGGVDVLSDDLDQVWFHETFGVGYRGIPSSMCLGFGPARDTCNFPDLNPAGLLAWLKKADVDRRNLPDAVKCPNKVCVLEISTEMWNIGSSQL